MENDEFLKDEFLHDLMQQLPEESPSDGFVSRVMTVIAPLPVSEKKSFYLYLRSGLPYIAIGLTLIFVVLTSDLPFLNYFPGKEFFINAFVPYLNSLTDGFKSLFGNVKDLSIPVMVVIAAGLFFLIDKLFTGRKMAHQTSL